MGVQGGAVLVPTGSKGQWKRGSGKGANAHTRGKMGYGVVYSPQVQSMHVDGGVGRWGRVLRLRHLQVPQCWPLCIAIPLLLVVALCLRIAVFISARRCIRCV